MEFLQVWQLPECGRRIQPLLHKLKSLSGIVEPRKQRANARPGVCMYVCHCVCVCVRVRVYIVCVCVPCIPCADACVCAYTVHTRACAHVYVVYALELLSNPNVYMKVGVAMSNFVAPPRCNYYYQYCVILFF